LGMIY